MAKGKTTVFYCQNCGYESSKWAGQCPSCREWNTFVEEVVQKGVSAREAVKKRENLKPVSLKEVDTSEALRLRAWRSLTECWAEGSCPAPWCWWAVTRA